MTKTFKEIYNADKDAPEQEKELAEEYTTTVNNEIDPDVVVNERPSPTMTVIDGGLPETNTKTPMPPVKEPLAEEIKDVLTEQREQSAAVLESVMKTNTKIANNISKLVKGSKETNEKLVEAITALTDKIKLLEAKLEAIENLKIPTPIVNLQMPNTKTRRDVYRDERGLISHITETDIADDEDK